MMDKIEQLLLSECIYKVLMASGVVTSRDACDLSGSIEAAVLEAQWKQEPVCFFNGYYGGRVVVEMLNPRVVYPIGTALYAAPITANAR